MPDGNCSSGVFPAFSALGNESRKKNSNGELTHRRGNGERTGARSIPALRYSKRTVDVPQAEAAFVSGFMGIGARHQTKRSLKTHHVPPGIL